MILSLISAYIAIDEIINDENEKYVHFITHLDEILAVPKEWNSIIYTSQTFVKILSSRKLNPIKKKYFYILEANSKQLIKLGDKEIEVTMFSHSGISGNVMFYFDDKTTRIMFTGPFIGDTNFLLNDVFRSYVLKGIHHLYVDNTRASSCYHTTMKQACMEISTLMKKYPGYQALLYSAIFGFEDLTLSLVKDFNFKVFLGSKHVKIFQQAKIDNIFVKNVTEANIIIGRDLASMEEIKRRFKRKLISIKFAICEMQLENNKFNENGLYLIQWSPHPTLYELYSFIAHIKPYNIHEIYSEYRKLPQILYDLESKSNLNLNSIVPMDIISEEDGILDTAFDSKSTIIENNDMIESESIHSIEKNDNLLPRNRVKRKKFPVAIVQPNNTKNDNW